VAVASFQPAAVVYREEQNFAWWVYVIVGLVEALGWMTLFLLLQNVRNLTSPESIPALAAMLFTGVVLVVPLFLLVGLLRMTTEVRLGDLLVWFGWLPIYRRVVSIVDIQRVEVVNYRPLADFGGWGIRRGRDGIRLLSARGTRGVRLDLTDGSRMIIGSQRPEELAVAIEQAMRPGA
jgi:hypothetical protein